MLRILRPVGPCIRSTRLTAPIALAGLRVGRVKDYAPDVIFEEEALGGATSPALFASLSGIDLMRVLIRGETTQPPIHYLTGMKPTEVGIGTSVFTMPVTDWLLPPQGLIYGGGLAVLADGPLGSAVHTALPAATPYTTHELSLSVLRPVARDAGTLIARGRLIHAGRSLGLSEVFVEDDAGRLIAHGSSRCFIFPSQGSPDPADDVVPESESVPLHSTPPYQRPVEGEVLDPDVWQTRSGLDILQAQIARELPYPPIYYLTGAHPVDVSEGAATFAVPATRWLCAPHGNVEGGAIALLADSALAAAVQTTVPAGGGFASFDLKVVFLRGVRADGRDLTAAATVTNRGRSIATATAEVFDADGKKVAVAMGSSMIRATPVTASRPLSPVDEE
jgi:uncharacterized protein (TIGR00369 family)